MLRRLISCTLSLLMLAACSQGVEPTPISQVETTPKPPSPTAPPETATPLPEATQPEPTETPSQPTVTPDQSVETTDVQPTATTEQPVETPTVSPSSSACKPAAAGTEPAYKDPEVCLPERVEDLLGRMSLAEKIGQMTQA